jgi:hypothetical protein
MFLLFLCLKSIQNIANVEVNADKVTVYHYLCYICTDRRHTR